MNSLIKQVKQLQKQPVSKIVKQRLNEFSSFKNKSNEEWFSELCFCLLTANSKFKTAFEIQKQLGHEGFIHKSLDELVECIRSNKHRFHNNKARFIVAARKHINIKEELKSISEIEAREFLVKNIKGLGYKEASHFLRNVGYKNLAIIDRHILSVMIDNKLVKQKPISISKKIYLKLETKLILLAKELNMSLAELDLYLWNIKTGRVDK